jgi:hypothetical protein
MYSLAATVIEKMLDPEPSTELISDDVRVVDPSEHMLEVEPRAYEGPLNWSWSSSPEWTPLGAC